MAPSCPSLVFYPFTLTALPDLWLRLRTVIPKDLKAFPREKWGAFEGGGRVDRILRHCLADHKDPKETRRRFEQIRIADSSYLRRRIRFLLVLAKRRSPDWATWHGDRHAANLRWAEHAGQL